MLQQFSPSAGRPHDDLDKYMDILLKVFKMFTKLNTVRPRDTRPQAAWTSHVHVFELGPKNLR